MFTAWPRPAVRSVPSPAGALPGLTILPRCLSETGPSGHEEAAGRRGDGRARVQERLPVGPKGSEWTHSSKAAFGVPFLPNLQSAHTPADHPG